jgi:hypothetical protein
MAKDTQENEYADFERPYMMPDKTKMPKDTVEELVTQFWSTVLEVTPDAVQNNETIYVPSDDNVRDIIATAYNKGVEEGRVEERERIANEIVDILPTGTLDAFAIIKAIEQYQKKLLTPLPDDKI